MIVRALALVAALNSPFIVSLAAEQGGGVIINALAQLGTGAALAFLALLGVAGVTVGQALPEASKGTADTAR